MKKTTPTPVHGTVGTFADIDIDAYHAGAGHSNSGLMLMAKSPYLYYMRKIAPDRPAEVERGGQLEGHIAHCAILEPHAFGERYVFTPEDAPRRPSITQINAKNPSPDTIKAIDWWENFGNENAGKTIITPEQYDVAWRQADSVRTIKEVRDAFEKGVAESSSYAIDPGTGLYLRVRPDFDHIANSTTSVLFDVKTCAEAGDDEFSRQIARKGYHHQDAMYSKVHALATKRKVAAFVFVAVESEYPYAANAIQIKPEGRERGAELLERNLKMLKTCEETGVWPGYTSGGIHEVDLPRWSMED